MLLQYKRDSGTTQTKENIFCRTILYFAIDIDFATVVIYNTDGVNI